MANREAQAEAVILTITNHIFTDESGADVQASMERFADIVEQQVEQQLGGRIANLEVRTHMGDVLHSIVVYGSDEMTADDEQALRDDLESIETDILNGQYGDWVVEAK